LDHPLASFSADVRHPGKTIKSNKYKGTRNIKEIHRIKAGEKILAEMIESIQIKMN
jgi:hypothetical protein